MSEDKTMAHVIDDNRIIQKKTDDMLDWWIGTVFFAFFPAIVSIIISLCRYGSVDINRIFGDGELILCAFSITTPSLIGFFKADIYNKGYKKLFYLLLLSVFFELITYTSIKTNSTNIPLVVYITSILCVISSVLISWQGEKCVQEGVTGEHN